MSTSIPDLGPASSVAPINTVASTSTPTLLGLADELKIKILRNCLVLKGPLTMHTHPTFISFFKPIFLIKKSIYGLAREIYYYKDNDMKVPRQLYVRALKVPKPPLCQLVRKLDVDIYFDMTRTGREFKAQILLSSVGNLHVLRPLVKLDHRMWEPASNTTTWQRNFTNLDVLVIRLSGMECLRKPERGARFNYKGEWLEPNDACAAMRGLPDIAEIALRAKKVEVVIEDPWLCEADCGADGDCHKLIRETFTKMVTD
jgi:hypothetical protein